MNSRLLLRRSLAYHWRAHLAVTLGVIAAGAALTGALLVGDSMRASLQANAMGRLGRVDKVITGPRFFREVLADELADGGEAIAPVIMLRGGVSHATSQARANQVGILGVNERFWALHGAALAPPPMPEGNRVILNQALANDIGAQVGDDVILRLGKPQDVSVDTLLGRRDQTTTSARLTVAAVIPADDLGAFELNVQQQTPRNLFVPLATLQRVLDQPTKTNALLVEHREPGDSVADSFAARLQLADYGLTLRTDAPHGYIALESDAFLIPPALEEAARSAADATGLRAEPILAYLANRIAAGGRAIPYSTIAAIPADGPTLASLRTPAGAPLRLVPGEILLNTWSADALNASGGERVDVAYYRSGAFGRLDVASNAFTLAGVAALSGSAADPGFTPPYPGVTDVRRLSDWDPPFPMDLKRLTDADEDYWETYRTTPKAFLTLADGQRLWTTDHDQNGRITSLRLWPADDADPAPAADAFQAALRRTLTPAAAGLTAVDVRAVARSAGQGSTDFSSLFIGFSFFLIAAALLLVALLFRLGAERRAHEVGLLLALGFSQRRVSRLLLAEGAASAAVGAALGVLAGVGYAQLMLLGLRTAWSDAVHAPFLRFAGTPGSYALGGGITFAVALPALLWGIRNLRRQPASRLLAGATEPARPAAGRTTRRPALLAGFALAAGLGLIGATFVSGPTAQPLAFFGGGSALLVAGIAAFAMLLRSHPDGAATHRGPASTPVPPTRTRALIRLGLRNAPRHPGRSLLIVALIASATFVTTAIQAFRMAPPADVSDLHGGTGGFSLIAEASTPLPYDLNTPAGREALNLTPATDELLARATCMPFRLRGGDAASCLNLYRPTAPRILGVPCAMRHRGGFTFATSAAETDAERANPWTLLERELEGGAIPAIGDEASVLWQLHSGLGKDYTITDQAGRPRRLRFVALLKGSVLQGELLVAEERFTELFPAVAGHAYFLIEAPAGAAPDVARHLEADLAPYAFDVTDARERLADLFAVQNTYLSTFQLLGGLGALLGSVGLIAVMLRNVWERRREYAVMQVVGFSKRAVQTTVLAENAALILAGLAIGVSAALIAIAPRIAEDVGAVAWGPLGLLVVGLPALGVGVAAIVLALALRAPLLPALRRE